VSAYSFREKSKLPSSLLVMLIANIMYLGYHANLPIAILIHSEKDGFPQFERKATCDHFGKFLSEI